MPDAVAFLVTCEHGGNRVPREYAALFRAHAAMLATHRGFDPGTYELARRFAQRLRCELVASRVTRLLVDLNRSPGHRSHFSEISRALNQSQQRRIMARYYTPHRTAVEKHVRRATARGRTVIHVAVHSFTPVLRGKRRRADVGLLYDPRRRLEDRLCKNWQAALRRGAPTLRVWRNYPYRGYTDGLTTHLRSMHPPDRYVGIELEVSQRFPLRSPNRWRELQPLLICTFAAARERVGLS